MLYNRESKRREQQGIEPEMQQSSLILFCEECGAANQATSAHCVACQHPLTRSAETLPAPEPAPLPVTPVSVAPPVVRAVVAGNMGMLTNANMPVNLLPGALLFGHYQICREIGRGGFSIVYLAEDLKAARKQVAIKRIHLRALTPRQVIDATETCNREIQMLTRLKNVRGVPQFYESFTDAENWYLVMQYIEGQTLEEHMQEAPGGHLSEAETLEIGAELASILQALHNSSPQVIFRDVKPSNIMITPERHLYLIDFGIARFFTPGQKKDTTRLGSPGYAPPEQYGKAQTDERADIYSLGMTLQTLYTGSDPLDLAQGESARNSRQPSRRLRELIAKMSAPEVRQRPASMGEVRHHLQWTRDLHGKIRRLVRSVVVGMSLGVAANIALFLVAEAHLGGFAYFLGWGVLSLLNTVKRRNAHVKRLTRDLSRVVAVISFALVVILGVSLYFSFFLQ